MNQINFKYSLVRDIIAIFDVYRQRKLIKDNKIIVFRPSFFRFLRILFFRPKINRSSDIKVNCYWVSHGTWGSYEYPDKIMIMPFDLPEDMSLEELIDHEIDHLKHPEAEEMEHKEKEKYIESIND